jgi:hypothetical protein
LTVQKNNFTKSRPSALPWVSKTTVINNEGSQNELVYLTTDTDTYSGSVIDSLATDENYLFYLVSNLPLTAEVKNSFVVQKKIQKKTNKNFLNGIRQIRETNFKNFICFIFSMLIIH